MTELEPLPEFGHKFAPRWPSDEGGFTAAQMRAYAMQHIAPLEREIARQKEVIGSVNARCDHLGMRLRDIKAERDAMRERCADALRCALDALDHCTASDPVRHRAVAERLRDILNG